MNMSIYMSIWIAILLDSSRYLKLMNSYFIDISWTIKCMGHRNLGASFCREMVNHPGTSSGFQDHGYSYGHRTTKYTLW